VTTTEVTPALISALPLPRHDDDDVKQGRGTVLIVGGTTETAGALVLAGIAALRVGAGRLRIMTVDSVAPSLQAAVPEARVVPLRADPHGNIDAAEAHKVGAKAARADAVVVGPGVLDADATEALVDAITGSGTEATVVVDAGAVAAIGRHPEWASRVSGRLILTPNEGEMRHVDNRADGALRDRAADAATATGCIVALRAPETWVATPGGDLFVLRGGTIGLATSGSGDVAAGVFGGLAAQGADPLTTAVWSPYLHGRAGERLSERIGRIGFLARELLDELPTVLTELSHA
jgi:ADP-dependent NAD(P)H-hydrate dehydratase